MSKIDFAVGGQAVIEGVMMRSPGFVTIAVRKEDGSIKLKDNSFTSYCARLKLGKIPLVRGVVSMIEMMIVGMKALNFAAQEQLDDIEKSDDKEADIVYIESINEPSKVVSSHETKKEYSSWWQKAVEILLFTGSIVTAFALSIFLFKFLPLWLTTTISENFPSVGDNFVLFNSIDGILKTVFFILYIAAISYLPGIKRVFEYHGAEHKSIMAYENGKGLTVENARAQTRFHPRCGTSFILIVFIASILVYTVFPKQENFWINFSQRIAILPLIAGVSYEFLKYSAKKQEKKWMRTLITPGLWLQRLTTREPDDAQLEVSLTALKKALELEEKK